MSANFKRVSDNQIGYDTDQVDSTIALARKQFAEPSSRVVGASALRTSQFALAKGGYEIAAVDAALDRLDDAFAQNEAKRLLALSGHQGAREHIANMKKTLVQRASRPKARRFNRTGLRSKGYSKRQVDAVINRVLDALNTNSAIEVGYLRQVVFSPRWGGYQENQVDAFIDLTVEFLQLSGSVL